MNLSMEKKEYIDSVFDNKSLGWLFPVLETGQAVCKEFMNLNSGFFDCLDYLNTVPGHLLSYSINKQLIKQSFLPLFPFDLHKEKINKRNNYCIPVLTKGNVNISILRGANPYEIDSNGKEYLKKKCQKNNELDGQINWFDSDAYEEKNYHGVLLYGCVKDWEGISFADILFFDSQLKSIYHSINLLDKLRIYESSMSIEDKEKSLLNVKDIIKDLRKQTEA